MPFPEVHFSKKRLEQKNFADFMQLMIVSLLGTFGIFYDATVTNSVPDLSLQKPIAVISFMIIGIPINNKKLFKTMWLRVICVIHEKIMWAVGLSRSFGILQKVISIKTFFVAS